MSETPAVGDHRNIPPAFFAGPRVRAVMFDIGDTLISTAQPMRESARAAAIALRDLRVIDDPNRLVEEFLVADRSIHFPHINHFFSNHRIAMQACMRTLASSETNRWPIETTADVFLSYYRVNIRQRILPDENVSQLLDRLRRLGIKLGALSNGSILEQIEVLVRMNIIQFFDDIVISEEAGLMKPSPELFILALTRLEVAPHESVFVGDSWSDDVVGATNAGLRAFYLRDADNYEAKARETTGHQPVPHVIVRSLPEIGDVIETIVEQTR
jgi:putative hydrolase of the HAD superfamily